MSQPTEVESCISAAYMEREELNVLLGALTESGYTVIGPTARDGAIVYGEVRTDSDLPVGITDEQNGGHYRIKRTSSPSLFSYAVGPHSLKNYLYPSKSLLYRARGSSSDFTVDAPHIHDTPRYAFIGVRACELHAMGVQDKVFLGGLYADPGYRARRASAFIVAVNCHSPSGACFCASMGTGPKVTADFDLSMTEVCAGEQHYFVIECGSAPGKALLDRVPHRAASAEEVRAAEEVIEGARQSMGRTMDTDGIRDLLYRNANSPRWEETAKRCLACANCTMACPTCFCSTVEDTTSLTGDVAERRRVWDSCYTMDFSHIHGGSVRKSGAARYRHWITHKLASWHDQFNSSGCVGCGRCITWCPVGIDITEEVAALRQAEAERDAGKGG